MSKHNVIAYIDGFNLYYGLRVEGLRWAYWLNLQNLMRLFLHPDQDLVHTRYFTSRISKSPEKQKRQATFLDALRTLPDLTIQYGHYLSSEVICSRCGHTYLTHHEKKTDVNIATALLLDAFDDRFRTALLVTADSDLSTPIQVIHDRFPNKKVVILFPPGRSSKELIRRADGYEYIGVDKLSKSLFPDEVLKSDGYILKRPESWREEIPSSPDRDSS